MSEGKRYFVITGMGHSATTWLAEALNLYPNAAVTHETFDADRATWLRELRTWIATDSPVVGSVNPHAVNLFSIVEAATKPRWAFVWRDPLVALHRDLEGQHPLATELWDCPALLVGRAITVYGAVERALQSLDKLGRPVSHWGYPAYTTGPGLARLAAWLGLEEMVMDLPAPANIAAAKHYIPPPAEWDYEVKRQVLGVFRHFPLCSEAIWALKASDYWVLRDEEVSGA